MPSFGQRSMFDVLDVEEVVEEYDVEEEVPSESEPQQSSDAPMSKSAKKRAARAARLAAEAEQAAGSSSAKTGAATKANGATASTTQNEPAPSTASASAPAAASGQTAAQDREPAKPKAAPAVPAASSATNESAPASKAKPQSSAPAPAARSASPPGSSAWLRASEFNPSLPTTLPQRTPAQLERKRKAEKDFSPGGPNDLPPSSPNKNSVKFEDGIIPGEGKEGEKTIVANPAPAPIKNQNFIERTVWTFIMIFGFIALLCMGQPYMILLVMVCQTLVYKEVTALFDLRDHGGANAKLTSGEKSDQWSSTINWYFFVVTNYFLYGESIIYYFKHIVFVDAYFLPFARNHRFISFMLYTLGFVAFVANLQRQHLRQQFALFCWVHITLLLTVVSSHFIVNNILEGMIWFFVPASLVICNDVFAYVCGKLFGRTPLIKLSPKKTVEGFVGAYFCTLIFALGWSTFFMRFPYMVCPARDLGVNAFSTITCKLNPVFVWREFELTGPIAQILTTILGHAPPKIPYTMFQLHSLVMATFASLVAPFGGFFASGFKRAFNIKDFGHSIPGHGGMTDRMDCQFMMGLFAYVYYSSLIRIQNITVGSILQTVVVSLTTEEQLELVADLKRFLEGQGVITP